MSITDKVYSYDEICEELDRAESSILANLIRLCRKEDFSARDLYNSYVNFMCHCCGDRSYFDKSRLISLRQFQRYFEEFRPGVQSFDYKISISEVKTIQIALRAKLQGF